MKIRMVGATALWFLVSSLPTSAQFSITPLSPFGSGGWLAPTGYNGSTYTYLTTADTERGLACSSNHLYLVSRNGGDFIRILDAKTGADLGALNLGSGVVTGGTFNVNMVAVGGDGAIYVGNLATGPAPFRIYRWANDLSHTIPTVAYSGVPLAGARLGDSLAAITSGGSTLLAAGFNSTPSVTGDNGYALINVTAGTGTAIGFAATPPAAGDFRLGITFTDATHVLGTQGGSGNAPRYSSFSGSVGTLLASPALASTDERPLAFAVVGGVPLLAALSTADSHVSLYDLTDPDHAGAGGASQRDQRHAADGQPHYGVGGLGTNQREHRHALCHGYRRRHSGLHRHRPFPCPAHHHRPAAEPDGGGTGPSHVPSRSDRQSAIDLPVVSERRFDRGSNQRQLHDTRHAVER